MEDKEIIISPDTKRKERIPPGSGGNGGKFAYRCIKLSAAERLQAGKTGLRISRRRK